MILKKIIASGLSIVALNALTSCKGKQGNPGPTPNAGCPGQPLVNFYAQLGLSPNAVVGTLTGDAAGTLYNCFLSVDDSDDQSSLVSMGFNNVSGNNWNSGNISFTSTPCSPGAAASNTWIANLFCIKTDGSCFTTASAPYICPGSSS